MKRRAFLSLLAGLTGAAAHPAWATIAQLPPRMGQQTPFSLDQLIERARKAARQSYRAPVEVPQPWKNLSYDQYRAINFRPERKMWLGTDTPFQLDFFSPGLYFHHPVRMNVVENGVSRAVMYDRTLFENYMTLPDLPTDASLGFSGLRLHTDWDKTGRFDEFFVMQGASYFRGIARDQAYGLSARGLAVNTAGPEGEEFPDFTEYWVERPAPDQSSITVHAYLDGPSVTGAYSFAVTPGTPTTVEVSARIFNRRDIDNVGIAPLTSMFLFDETNRNRFDDFRPAVHDNDGLMIQNGAGETLWRPLANPTRLQVSSFFDEGPRGFGLMQRSDKFSDFADLEAQYHRRPGLWIEPKGNWGRGAVTLVEIPADREIFDNIVAYWRPADGLERGAETQLDYTMHWGNGASNPEPVAKVINTRIGGRYEGGKVVTIDFENTPLIPNNLDELTLHMAANNGQQSDGVIQRNPETGGPRVAFNFDPGDAGAAELRAQLRHNGKLVSEVWLYRWTST